MAEPASAAAKPEPPPAKYGDRLTEVTKWAVAGVGTVGATAVTALSLDRLGTGDSHVALMIWAFLGLLAFAAGVAAVVGAVVWHVRSGRVTIAYLLGRSDVAKKIKQSLNQYLLGGAVDLEDFQKKLNALVAKTTTTAEERRQLRRLLAARTAILATASAERARIVNGYATRVMAAGIILVTLGGSTFAYASNRDIVLREERLAEEERERLATGNAAYPEAPSPVLVSAPADAREIDPAVVTARLGEQCAKEPAKAQLLEIASPPGGTAFGSSRAVFHVVVERSSACKVMDLWLPPEWVSPRPKDKDEGAPKNPSQGKTTTAEAGG